MLDLLAQLLSGADVFAASKDFVADHEGVEGMAIGGEIEIERVLRCDRGSMAEGGVSINSRYC